MSRYKKLVERKLMESLEPDSKEILDEDFKSALKAALGTAAVAGGLMLPGAFEDKEAILAGINAGVEGDLPKVIDYADANGHMIFKLEGFDDENNWVDADDFLKDKEDLLHEKKYGHTLRSHGGERLEGEDPSDLDEGLAGAVLGGAAGSLVGHPFIGGAVGSIAQDALTDDDDDEDDED